MNTHLSRLQQDLFHELKKVIMTAMYTVRLTQTMQSAGLGDCHDLICLYKEYKVEPGVSGH